MTVHWRQFKSWLFEKNPDRSLPWRPIAEIGLILIWTLIVSQKLLDFSPLEWPHGREFGLAIQPHYLWQNLLRCGSCVFWNGSYNGGQPAFVELHAAVLHPLVILATLIWGGINGSKVIIMGSLAMAGIGQWWLAHVMKLGLPARLGAAALAVSGGHLAGRMEIGVIGVILSTAACSLVIAPGLKLAQSRKRRDAILLGVILALAIVSGQGYLQIGLALSIFPAFLLFLVDDESKVSPVWREFLLAGGLALLLAGVFLVPLTHFWPQFGKDVDPNFISTQPIEYVPLNYVINDESFYRGNGLGKQPLPYLYFNFIGWIPVILAFLPLLLAPKEKRKQLFFFWLSLILVIMASSGTTLRALARILPEFSASIRNPSLIQGLGVPLIVALAAWGMDLAIKQSWPLRNFTPAVSARFPRLTVGLNGLLFILALIIGVKATYTFSSRWLFVSHQEDIVWTRTLDAMKTADSQWVSLPFGEHFWGPLAAEADLKITDHWRPSHWRDRENPSATLLAGRWETLPETTDRLVTQYEDVKLVRRPEVHYAAVLDEGGQEIRPCVALAQGGYISVNCNNKQAGQLQVQENLWAGWQAWRDGERIDLDQNAPWLSVEAPAGNHQYEFRYRPWDVYLGLSLTVIGSILAVFFWLRAPRQED